MISKKRSEINLTCCRIARKVSQKWCTHNEKLKRNSFATHTLCTPEKGPTAERSSLCIRIGVGRNRSHPSLTRYTQLVCLSFLEKKSIVRGKEKDPQEMYVLVVLDFTPPQLHRHVLNEIFGMV